jgi:hypothetical protein
LDEDSGDRVRTAEGRLKRHWSNTRTATTTAAPPARTQARPGFAGGTGDKAHDRTAVTTVRPNTVVARATTAFIVMRSATSHDKGVASATSAP